jgi:hypothetical protein
MLSEEAIKEFQELYEKLFGERISKEEALKKSISLLRLYKAVLKKDV